jgi:ornithine carbamoyltransferase
MADVLTIQEHCEDLQGTKIAFIGDGNNVARSLAFASAKLGMKMVIATPPGYQLDAESIQKANQIAADTVTQTNDPARAVVDANIIYTDTWVSMGQEQEKQKRCADFAGFQVNAELLKAPAGQSRPRNHRRRCRVTKFHYIRPVGKPTPLPAGTAKKTIKLTGMHR